MSQFRFIHASDLHLDTPFKGIGRIAPVIGEKIRDASLKAWDNLVKLTIEKSADFLLLAGDIYDGAERGLRAQKRFLEGLQRLSDRNINVFIVHGNHDPMDGWTAIRNWPDGVKVFKSEEVEAVPVMRGTERLAVVHGISFSQRDVQENLALRFKRTKESGVHIGLLHCNAGSNPDHAFYSPCSIEDLCRAGMDYWALGHIHKRQFLREGNPWIAYPGNLQGRSPKPSEMGIKGVLVVDVVDKGIRPPQFEPVDQVRFVMMDIDASGIDDLAALMGGIHRKLSAMRGEHPNRDLMVTIVLRGRTPIHDDLRKAGYLEDLLKELRQETIDESPFVWFCAIENETWGVLDRENIRRRGDFSSELMRLVEELSANPARLSAFLASRLESLDRPLISKWGPTNGSLDGKSLLGTAEELALDALEAKLEK